MIRSGSSVVLGLGVLVLAADVTIAGPAMEGIEVRLEAKSGGFAFTYADGTQRTLERMPLLGRRHFARVEVRPTTNRNNPGLWQVEVIHNASGRARFVAAGEAGRDRGYCVVIGRTIDHCAAFPPPGKGIYERGQTLMDRTGADAHTLAARIGAAITGLTADERAADRASRQSPEALLRVLYRRAVKEQSPDWLGGEEREVFWSREMVALWEKVDAVRAAGNEDAVFDSDRVAATNALELKDYRIHVESRGPERATARVALTYKDSPERRDVVYELVKEKGRWRIAELGEGESSVGANLRSFIAPPAAPAEGR